MKECSTFLARTTVAQSRQVSVFYFNILLTLSLNGWVGVGGFCQHCVTRLRTFILTFSCVEHNDKQPSSSYWRPRHSHSGRQTTQGLCQTPLQFIQSRRHELGREVRARDCRYQRETLLCRTLLLLRQSWTNLEGAATCPRILRKAWTHRRTMRPLNCLYLPLHPQLLACK